MRDSQEKIKPKRNEIRIRRDKITIGELLKILKEYPEEWEISYNAYASYLALYLGDEEIVIIIPHPNYN